MEAVIEDIQACSGNRYVFCFNLKVEWEENMMTILWVGWYASRWVIQGRWGAACLFSRYLRKSWSLIREEDWVLRSRNTSPLLWDKAVRERKLCELSVVGRRSVARSMENSAVALCSGNSEGHPAHSWSAYMSPFLQNVERLVKKHACFQSQILIYINIKYINIK